MAGERDAWASWMDGWSNCDKIIVLTICIVFVLQSLFNPIEICVFLLYLMDMSFLMCKMFNEL